MYVDEEDSIEMPIDDQFSGGGGGINPGKFSQRLGGNGGGGLFSGGGMDRRQSVGSSIPIDAAVSDLLGRRPSLGYESGGGGMDTMERRDSLESTAAVLDACILDLARRRRGMGSIGGTSSPNPGGFYSHDMGLQTMGQNSNTGLQSALAARQRQLQIQQAELERRQQELELQRQQFLSTLQQDPTSTQPSLAGIPSQQEIANMMMGGVGVMGYPYPGMSNNMLPMNHNMPLPNEELDMVPPPMDNQNRNQTQQWWVCQICNSKAFASHNEAMEHEAVCEAASHLPHPSMSNRLEMQDFQQDVSPDTLGMITRPLCLAMPTDKDWLTPLHCFVRRHCVEVFTAGPDDVVHPAKGKRKPIQVGQVGIRCPFCHIPGDPNNRERGSVYYPTTISSIYNATMNLLQRHLHSCPTVPDNIMEQYQTLKADDARSGTSKKYWVESALSLGLVDTPNGIRYSNLTPPPLPRLSFHQHATSTAKTRTSDDLFSSKSNAAPDTPPKDAEGGTDASISDQNAKQQFKSDEKKAAPKQQPRPLVEPNDKPYATEFSYELLGQMQPCVFTEADRLGKRKGLPAGYAGLACRHCFGGYGSGRFFPSSIKTLSDTSKTLNVLHNHMMKCRKCPQEVKMKLEKYRLFHDEERSKMKFGSQKAFFARIWDRLHGSNNPGKPAGMKRKAPHADHYLAGPPMKQQHQQQEYQQHQQEQDHLQQDPLFGGYMDQNMSIMGMGGLDVLSRQAASATPEVSPSKRHKTD